VYTLGTDTGRMSCVRPNLQQLKRTGGLRACITADPGMMIVSADFQAVELRTAAALAGDGALYEMIAAGDAERAAGRDGSAHDLHWKIARQVWGPDAGKGARYNAKRGVFGRLYGAGIPKIAATLGISEAEAQAVADVLDALAPGVATWSAGMRKYVREGGTSFQTYSGRVIWLDRSQPHKSGNFAIQGTAREFLADGLLRWRQSPWGNCTVLPVHDEVLATVPADQAQAATAELARCMTTQLNGMAIVVEPSEPSFAWADAS
jgi:DNA polymerase I-like protein with 3'-5' exonuclease and polymerase domains